MEIFKCPVQRIGIVGDQQPLVFTIQLPQENRTRFQFLIQVFPLTNKDDPCLFVKKGLDSDGIRFTYDWRSLKHSPRILCHPQDPKFPDESLEYISVAILGNRKETGFLLKVTEEPAANIQEIDSKCLEVHFDANALTFFKVSLPDLPETSHIVLELSNSEDLSLECFLSTSCVLPSSLCFSYRGCGSAIQFKIDATELADSLYIYGSLRCWRKGICVVSVNVAHDLEISADISSQFDLLRRLFEDINAPAASQAFRNKNGLEGDKSLTYGEIDFVSFYQLMKSLGAGESDVFWDLGCGCGRTVLETALCFRSRKCYGIELLDDLFEICYQKLASLSELLDSQVEFFCGSFLDEKYSKRWLDTANIIFCSSVCFADEIWNPLCALFEQLPSGTRVISLKKINSTCESSFELQSYEFFRMSWGKCPVYIYSKN